MGVIAKYKFNQELYADFIPEFNSEFTDYTITDEIDTDGYTIRTIESDSLPTIMRFGQIYNAENDNATPKSLSLLEIYEMDLSTVTSIALMFRKCENLTAIHCQFNCNFNNITTLQEMFHECFSLTSLDVSNFNTKKVTITQNMFNGCSSLISLDVSNFNTENVTNMGGMFYKCSLLTSLNLSNFNTENVTTMQQMFQDCSSLISLDVSNFNTKKVANMDWMFSNCSLLTSLDVSNFNTKNVTTMSYMFNNCSSLTSLDVSNFNTENVTHMDGMFNNCSSLTLLNVSNFNTKKVTGMNGMFENCSSLTLLDISSFNGGALTTGCGSMFFGCVSLQEIIFPKKFITNKCTNISAMFRNCPSLKYVDISDWDTSNVTTINQTFNGCSSLTSLDLSGWDTTNVTSYYQVFNGCTSLQTLDISNFNILSSVTEINTYIVACKKLVNVGMLYCNSETINIIANQIEGTRTIWYSDAKLEDLTKKENITYKEYKMNILESDEEINLRSNGDVYDELNLLTGELIQRIDENGEILSQEVIKTINLKGKPSINWQGDTYLHLENNTLYPQLDCGIESINYYEIPKLKANTLYTLQYVGEPTQCIFGGLTYETENNMVLTSGSSDNLLYFDKEVRKVILIEGDVRDRNFDYFEGIESLGAVEIITHKSDMSIFSKVQIPPHIQLRRLPDGTCDELDIKTGILTRRIDENYNLLEEEITEKLILNYNNSCNYGVILPRGTSDNYNVITNEYKQNLDFIPIDGSIAFDTATIKDTTVKFSVAISKFEVDTTNVRGSDGIYCDNNLFKYEASDNDYEHAYIENDTTLHIYVNKSRLSSYDQVGFQLYLTNNPFNLYYAMRTPIISYVNYEDLDPEKASWEMLDCTEDGSITIESGNMDKTLLLDCLDYVAPTKNRFEIDLLKANTQYTVYAEGVSGRVQLNFGGNIVNFTSGNIYTSGETQLVEFYTDNEIKNLIIIEGDTRNETIEFFEGLKSSENVTVISSNAPFVFGKGGKIQ